MVNVLCLLLGHKTVASGFASELCMRCDKTIYAHPVKAQGDAYKKALNRTEYRKAMDQRKYAGR